MVSAFVSGIQTVLLIAVLLEFNSIWDDAVYMEKVVPRYKWLIVLGLIFSATLLGFVQVILKGLGL